ncbi:MAG: GGDEF domain-containing protein [Lachnospiraceae bacterium]|nr:GGDEF domain-containing protein [Lachnospiraceae bacterium]
MDKYKGIKTEKTKKINTLTVRFAFIFFIFSIVLTAVVCAVLFRNESKSFKKIKLEEIRNVNEYLETIIQHDGDDFKDYYKYLKQYHDKMDVPFDFEEYDTALDVFNEEFKKVYPDAQFGIDVTIDELPEDLLLLYLIYDYEYWTLTFEDACEVFDLDYTYMILPDSDEGTVAYLVDATRDERDDKPGYMEVYIIDDPEENPKDKVKVLWNTWEKGEQLDEFQKWENEYGNTYTCYTPLYMEDEKVALICAEIDINSVNKEILRNSLHMSYVVGIVMLICLAFMLWFVNRRYLRRISMLTENVKEYSESKDVAVADKVKKLAVGKTEVGELARQTSEMMLEIDDYMRTLVYTNKELNESKQRERDAQNMAMKDGLTGIRNKTAYENMRETLDNRVLEGFTEFGVAMADMNYLKLINDTYGHDKGDLAIVKLSRIICNVFKHSPVFRIGGDEFAVILMGEDYTNADKLVEKFRGMISELSREWSLEKWDRISAAIGMAKFDPLRDLTVESVFKRADDIMYNEKVKMKGVRRW